MAFVVGSGPVSLFRNEIRAGVVKMLLFSVLILCCVFVLYRNTNESEALVIYNPRYRYYNLAAGSYGGYYDQKRYEIQSDTQVSKKSSQKRKAKTQPPIDLSFEPLGALKIDSLVHGEIEINPDKFDDVLLSLATGTLSLIPDFYQYVPSLPSFYGDEPADRSSEDRSSPRKHRTRPSHRDEIEEDDISKSPEPKDDHSGTEDNSEPSTDENGDKEPSEDDDNAAEEHDDDSKTPADSEPKHNSEDEPDKNEPKSEPEPSKEISKEDKNSKEVPELIPETEVPIEIPPQEGYVDKFVKYYSYAKPLAKAASLFVPGLGQYRAVMLGVEMGDLAYNVASMYTNGDGYLSMGYFLGKEAFKRLGRRNEPEPEPPSQNSNTKISSTDLDDFLEKVKTTQFPLLDEKKEQEIKTSVSDIIYKYCYDQEQYQDETERAKFIDFMISCVKFIALHSKPTCKEVCTKSRCIVKERTIKCDDNKKKECTATIVGVITLPENLCCQNQKKDDCDDFC